MSRDHPPQKRKGRPRGSESFAWRAFFQQSTTPVFVLGKDRRLRFANAAWEKLTGVKLADALGMVCSARKSSTPLAAALTPTPEAQAGKPDHARRHAPTGRSGPPWWDITFAPLNADDGTFGIVGFIAVTGEPLIGPARKIPASVTALREQHAAHFTLDLFGGPSPASRRFLGQLRHAATATAPVWLIGEPGSGKETAARVIHHAGPRRNNGFVGLDCAGLQPYLVDSLLFGHGGALGANVGTLYLKEPAALPRDLQQCLADRFTGSDPNTPRLICGSARSSRAEVDAAKLVPVFHTALSVLEIAVPPLRDRLADLPRFASSLLPNVAIDSAAFDVLHHHTWPGNLRELADTLREAATLAQAGPVKAEHLPRELRERAGIVASPPRPKPLSLDPILEAVEKRLIELAMQRTNGHQTKAAELLGIFRTRLARRLEALGLQQPDTGERPA